MEHTLPPGVEPPIRIPVYGQTLDVRDDPSFPNNYKVLFDAIVDIGEHESPSQSQALWEEAVRLDTSYLRLCLALLSVTYYSLLDFFFDNVDDKDFLVRSDDGILYLTTRALHKYIIARVLDYRGKSSTSDRRKIRTASFFALRYNKSLLASLSVFLDGLYDTQNVPEEITMLSKTHFACSVLHQALTNGFLLMTREDLEPSNFLWLLSIPPWFRHKMLEEGWCPRMMFKLFKRYSVDMLLHGYNLGTVRAGKPDDHLGCNDATCLAINVSSTSEVQHVEKTCKCAIVEAPVTEIVSILRADHIPVLDILEHHGTLTLSARRAGLRPPTKSGKPNYVCISHVWADGLGSPSSNVIAQCQLKRIADHLRNLAKADSVPNLYFWMDTLCIPNEPRYEEERERHIAHMDMTYGAAYAVVVIDADLLQVQSAVKEGEICSRLFMSSWISRLWTYQEAASNDRLLVMTADNLVDLDAEIQRTFEDYRNAGLKGDSEDLLQRSMGLFCTEDVQHACGRDKRSAESENNADTFTIDEPHSDISIGPEEHLQGSMETMEFWAPSNNNAVHVAVANELRVDTSHEAGEFPQVSMVQMQYDQYAQDLLVAIKDRTSSRKNDEAVVLGIMLRLDVNAILKANVQERTKTMLRAMAFIPGNVLFGAGPRLTNPGFHWAPVSFLSANKAGIDTMVGSFMGSGERELTTPRQLSELDGRGQGLISFNAAIQLHGICEYEAAKSCMFEIFTEDRLFRLDNFAKCNVPQMVNRFQAGKALVILLPVFEPSDFVDCEIGVLCSLDNAPRDSRVETVEYLARVLFGKWSNISIELSDRSAMDSSQSANTGSQEGKSEASSGKDHQFPIAGWIDARYWLVQ